ncbi:MAG TPA: hypothetical protein VJ765_06795 [Chitinophagaceae bacterium]|nr:hypothetical protein [Chitinophagaceae bacterium]
MKLKFFFLQVFSCFMIFSFGQKQSAICKFHSINNISLLNGQNEISAALQSVNGFQKGNWFAGLGVGLDYYIHRSVPLFADIRFEYGKGKNKFFAYADGGINFDWIKENDDEGPVFIWEGFNNSSEFQNGVYADAGLGYLVGIKKGGSGLLLSLGYSHKSLKETVRYQDWRTQQPTTDTYEYKLNRIAIKVGWKF